jgi:single-strand DNA-binding protein
MASFNRVILVGNLTRDVELKYLQSGTAVTEIGLAVNDKRKNQQTGEWIDEPVFVDITLWGRTAEIASEYLGKGSSVLIEGRLKFDQVGEQMTMLGSKGGGGPRQSQSSPQFDESEFHSPGVDAPSRAPSPAAASSAPGKAAEDIPF